MDIVKNIVKSQNYDDNWENRLTDKEKIEYFKKFKQKTESPTKIIVNYHISIPSEIKYNLTTLFERLNNHYYNKFDSLKIKEVIIEIHTINSWCQKTKSEWMQKQTLPCARYLVINYQPIIEIILDNPSSINSITKLNLIRLFGSELLGKIQFDKIVLNRFPFNNINKSKKYYSLSIQEKTIICRYFSRNSPRWGNYFQRIGSQHARSTEQKTEIGRNMFFSNILYQTPSNKDFQREVKDWFIGFNKNQEELDLKERSKQLDRLTLRLWSINIFLPKEKHRLIELKKENSWKFCHRISFKIHSLYSYLTSIVDILAKDNLFANAAKQLKFINIVDSDTQDTIDLSINLRIINSTKKSLISLNLAKDFLIDEALRTKEQIFDFNQFKLNLHLKYYKDSKNAINPEELNNYLIDKYSTNAFQRIYNICHYLDCVYKNSKHKEFAKKEIIKMLTYFLSFKELIEEYWIIFDYLSKKIEIRSNINITKKNIFGFRKGWANFFGNVFLIDYYKQNGNYDTKSKNRLKNIIYKSSLFKLNGIAEVITSILLQCYKNLGEDIYIMLNVLNPGMPIIDNFVLRNNYGHSKWNKEKVINISKKIISHYAIYKNETTK